jgi:hypothetical protein
METIKRKPGRPALPEGLRRRHKFEVLANDREYMQIQRNAEEAGLPMAQFLRVQALGPSGSQSN